MGDEYPVAKKLAILLPHLIRHNDEHAEDLEKWIALARDGECRPASKEMKKAQALMKKISGHLSAAAESVGVHGQTEAHHHHHEYSHDHHKGHGHKHHHHD